jgi:hypothetical protein
MAHRKRQGRTAMQTVPAFHEVRRKLKDAMGMKLQCDYSTAMTLTVSLAAELSFYMPA